MFTNASTERGIYKLNSTNLIQNSPIGGEGNVAIPIPTGNQKYEMIAHTHNAPSESTYSVFSYADLLAMYTLLRKDKIDLDKFVAFLSTADGTNYAFTINNPTQFLKVFATIFDAGFDYTVGLNRVQMREKYYTGNIDNHTEPLIKENSVDNIYDEKLFLDFLKATNMGLTLFEVNDTFDRFERVTHNTRTDTIDKNNCN